MLKNSEEKKNNGEKPKPKINLTNDQKPAKKKCC